MHKKGKFTKIDMAILIMIATFAVLIFVCAILNPIFILIPGALLLILAIFVLLNINKVHSFITKIIQGANYAGTKGDTQQGLQALSMPVAIVSGDKILWYNRAFKEEILSGYDDFYLDVKEILPKIGSLEEIAIQKADIELNNNFYSVYASKNGEASGVYLLYFVNDTAIKKSAEEYINTRPSVMCIAIDTYDEILKEMKDSDRSRIWLEINSVLEQFIGHTTGMLRKTSASRYFAVIEERHIKEMVKNKFSVLDKAREISVANGFVSLSIGIGRAANTIQECEVMAMQALDMALGRGGDQVAIKTKEGFEFYGGVSRSVEKRTKVRSRIIAAALCDLINQSESIIIAGHKNSDLDSIGSAAGVYRIAKACGKTPYIMADRDFTQAGKLIDSLKNSGTQFVTPDSAEALVGRKLLLIIVDTHMSTMLENKYVFENAANVVVIDHHRRCVGYIDNAVVFYHEPAASSASELVTELLQYTPIDEKDNKLTQTEAQALLAGIMLDTRNFSVHTGVRTFEAAAYLRRMGAQTQDTKKLFTTSLESYNLKSKLVEKADIYMGCAVVTQENTDSDLSIATPQAANDLLTIDGVQASFVIVDFGTQIVVSARSMGDVNVQIIMEKLGGGGHHTMAGTQIKDKSLSDVKEMVMSAIEEFREEENEKQQNKD